MNTREEWINYCNRYLKSMQTQNSLSQEIRNQVDLLNLLKHILESLTKLEAKP